MMKILIVTQYFWPENFRINDLVSGLLDRGHQVTVLTGIPNYPQGKFFEGYGLFRKTIQNYNGARVIRVPIIPRGNSNGIRLFINFISFVFSAIVFSPVFCREKYDGILVFEPSPVTVAIPALFIKALRKVPVLFWVQDLWPESLTATGAIASKRVLKMVDKLVQLIYRNCDKILITSNAFKESIISHGGRDETIHYFPQSAEDLYKPIVSGEIPEILQSIEKKFWIMFAGNIGIAQDFGTIISAAGKLSEYPDIQWIIIGDGRMRGKMEEEVRRHKLEGVIHFLGKHPLELMPDLFSKADTMLVTLKKSEIFAMTVPAKVQSYLACGRPIIAALDGEGSKIIAESGAGFICPTEDPDSLAQIALKMYKTPKTEREKMGASGRLYYENHFDRDRLLTDLLGWMEQLQKN